MKKYYFIIFFLLISTSMWLSDKFNMINLSQHASVIEQTLESQFNLKVLLGDNITFKFFPLPYISISGMRVNYDQQLMLESPLVKISLPFKYLLSLMRGIEPGVWVLKSQENILLSSIILKFDIFKKYLQSQQQRSDLEYTIQIDNGNIIDFTNDQMQALVIKNCDMQFNNKIYLKGLIGYKDLFSYEVNIANKGKDINLSLKDLRNEINFSVQNFDYSTFTLDKGIIQIYTAKTKTPIELDKSLQRSHPINFEADITSNINGGISLQNINFNKPFLSQPNLSVDLYKISDDILESHIDFEVSEVDLKALNNDNILRLQSVIKTFLGQRMLNIALQLKAKSVQLEDIDITDFNLTAYSVMGQSLIKECSAKLPDNGRIDLSGVVSDNEIRQRFNGRIKVISDDFNKLLNIYNISATKQTHHLKLEADIVAIRNMIKLSNIDMGVDDTTIDGNVTLYDVPYANPIKSFFVNINNLNFDDLHYTDDFNQYLQNLHTADHNKASERYFVLTNNNNWIRTFDKTIHIEADLHQPVIRGTKINNIKTTLNIKPSIVHIEKIIFNDENITGVADCKFVLPVLRPQINFNGNFKILNVLFINNLLPLLSDDSNDKINFLSANNYDGHFNFKVDQLIAKNNIIITDLSSDIDLRFGHIFLNSLQYALWGGKFKSNGDISFSSYNADYNLNFNIYNIQPKAPIILVTGLDKIDGYVSLAGRLYGPLNHYNDINKISGNVLFEGAAMTWNGFNLNAAIQGIDGDYTIDSKLQNIDYHMQYGTSLLDVIKGSMLIKNGMIIIDNTSIINSRFAGLYSLNYDLNSRNINGLGVFSFIPVNAKDKLVVNSRIAGNILQPTQNELDYKELVTFVKNKTAK